MKYKLSFGRHHEIRDQAGRDAPSADRYDTRYHFVSRMTKEDKAAIAFDFLKQGRYLQKSLIDGNTGNSRIVFNEPDLDAAWATDQRNQ